VRQLADSVFQCISSGLGAVALSSTVDELVVLESLHREHHSDDREIEDGLGVEYFEPPGGWLRRLGAG
jgi:hypothetical protein